ncbi:MAG: O-antigen ligase family protein [Patescibacteria group bacterium]
MSEPALAKWLRWLIYASALVPLIIFSQYMSPFHFGKVVVLRSIVQVMVALYLLLIWRDRSYLPKGHLIVWAFVAFTAAFTLTSITSIAPMQSFWGTLERMGGLFTFWHYLVFFMIAISVMRSSRDRQILLDLMIAAGAASAIYGFLQKTDWSFILGSGGRSRIFGTLGNPALFAGYQILVAFLALTLSFMRRTSKNWRIWYWGAGGLMLLAALSTAVRGSLIGIAVGALLWALLWSVLNRSKRAKIALLTGLSGLVAFVFLGIMFRNTSLVQHSSYLNRVTDFSSSTFTVKTRFWAWSAGLKGWSENPKTIALGWGPENFNVPFSKYFNPKFFTAPGAETFFDRAHNMFMEVLVTMGLVGTFSYIGIFVALFWTLAKMMRVSGDERAIAIGFTAMTVAYIIHNAFIFDTSANFLTFFMILAFVTNIAQRGLDDGKLQATNYKLQARKRWTGPQVTVAMVMGIVVVATVYATNVRPSLANYASTRAIVAGWQGDWVGAVNKYREAIDYDTPGRYEYRHRFAQYLLEVSGSPDIAKVPNFHEVMLQAISDVKNNVAENPQDYLPHLYLSRLYITLGKDSSKSLYNDLALQESARALEISPTFVRTYYEVAQAYINKGDLENAFIWFEKAQKLQPDVAVTYWYMGTVRYQIAAKSQDIAGTKEAVGYFSAALEKGYSLTEGDAQKLVNAFLQVGDMKSVVAVFQNLTVSFPAKSQYWSSLATAYVKIGRIQDAISAARKVIELSSGDAATQAEAEQFIRALGGTP